MKTSKTLKKYCLSCCKQLLSDNKSGYCSKHRPRSGEHNSFYGKHHSAASIENRREKQRNASIELWKNPDLLEKQRKRTLARWQDPIYQEKQRKDAIERWKDPEYRKKCSEASKDNWKDPSYREKVIQGVSKPRKPEFASEQSVRIRQWYVDNPEQLEIRSKAMKKSWAEGRITQNFSHCRSSKMETEFYERLKVRYPWLQKKTIHHGSKWYFPDILVDNKIVIEFFGDFWHANPDMYFADDIIYEITTALDIWKYDDKRIMELEALGYEVIIVWEKEYTEDAEGILNSLDQYINWESCCF